ncbi:hypothetical protein BDV39DRAFT_170708 [Aspergillus sergii]|uniref:Uncharacterized protein n=1 Tax=Aspergillus sergii TaxID=1034303 RepID=A0A5N6XEY9_9EURO|nr:hypothetical protein BDV39DRAFT_170708 [Aspergillus sergii]
MLSEADSDFALFAWSLSARTCLEWLVLKKREKQTKRAVNFVFGPIIAILGEL